MQGNQVDTDMQFTEETKELVRFLRIIDFTSNGKEIPRYILPPTNATYVTIDDVSIVRYGTLGTICRRFNGIIANNLFKVIPKYKISNNFIYYYLLSQLIQHYIKNSESSSVMSAIKHSTIANLPMTIYSEQNLKKFDNVADKIEKIILVNLEEINILNRLKNIIISELYKEEDYV